MSIEELEDRERYVYEQREDIYSMMMVMAVEGIMAKYGKGDIGEEGRKWLAWASSFGAYTGPCVGNSTELRNTWRRLRKSNPNWADQPLPEAPIPY